MRTWIRRVGTKRAAGLDAEARRGAYTEETKPFHHGEVENDLMEPVELRGAAGVENVYKLMGAVETLACALPTNLTCLLVDLLIDSKNTDVGLVNRVV